MRESRTASKKVFPFMTTEHSTRRQEVVKHGEKESRLDQFLGFYLDRLFADWVDRPEHHALTLLARSPASPAARAVISNSPDLLAAGVKMRIIFSTLEPSECMSDWSDLALIAAESDVAQSVEIARLGHAGLVDAHEQLVLGADMSWCGDSMRRDPLHRDTVEVYDPCCPATAGQSVRCFDALWSRSEVIKVVASNTRASNPDVLEGEDPMLTGGSAAEDGTLATTRH